MKAVSQIILINFIVYSITSLLETQGLYLNNLLALFPILSEHFSTHQLVTHIFAHGNFAHLVSNMFMLLLVGYDVERVISKSNFWKFFILSGMLSSGLYFLGSSIPILGASGAVFATMTCSILINWKLQSEFLSIRLRNAFFIFLIISEIIDVLININDDVGHIAHLLGVIFGLVYYRFYINNRPGISF